MSTWRDRPTDKTLGTSKTPDDHFSVALAAVVRQWRPHPVFSHAATRRTPSLFHLGALSRLLDDQRRLDDLVRERSQS